MHKIDWPQLIPPGYLAAHFVDRLRAHVLDKRETDWQFPSSTPKSLYTMYALTEYNGPDLDSVDEAVRRGLAFAERIENEWQKDSCVDGVQLYKRWVHGDFWAARVSYHSNVYYRQMYETLFKDHNKNEAQYIGMVMGCEQIPGYEGWQSFICHYDFPFPLSKRDMVIWIGQKETEEGTQFVNISLPRNFDLHRTKATYVSVEVVTRLDDGRIKWVMATTSDAGGYVPLCLQRLQVCSAIAEDVPQFMRWLFEKRLR